MFYSVLQRCQAEAPRHRFRFKNKLLTLDSTVLDVCASMFDWARFRRSKGAAKLHLQLDHDGCLPVFAHVTEAAVADVTIAQQLILPPGSIVAIDRGYIDYRLFEVWSEQKVGFVTRLEHNADYAEVETRMSATEGPIRRDGLIVFQPITAGRTITGTYRRIEVWLEDKQEVLVLLTNLLHLSAKTIADGINAEPSPKPQSWSHKRTRPKRPRQKKRPRAKYLPILRRKLPRPRNPQLSLVVSRFDPRKPG